MRPLCFIALLALAPLATADELTLSPQSWRQLRDLAVGEKDDRLAAMIAKMKAQSNVHAVALEYDVLLWKDNDLKSLPGGLESHVFEIGDKILFRVTSFADSYVYVFHRGPSGETKCLLPVDENQPAKLETGVPEFLPRGGKTIAFVGPAGVEELILVASAAPLKELDKEARRMFADRKAPKADPKRPAGSSQLKTLIQKMGSKTAFKTYDIRTAPSLPSSPPVRLGRSVFVQRPTRGPGFVLAQVSKDDSEPFVLNVKLRSK